MKKSLLLKSLFIAILLVFTLSGCENKEDKGMYIKPSEFSEETRAVLNIFDDEVQFFDIVLDETVKSETITVWVYKNGVWEESGNTSGPVELLDRQIAIRLNENSYDLYSIDESGHVKYSCPDLEASFDDAMGILGSRVEGETKLILNEETPILMKIGSKSGSMENYNVTEDFRSFECDAGIVITLTVSDEIVE